MSDKSVRVVGDLKPCGRGGEVKHLWLLLILGCHLPEPSSGCMDPVYGQPNANGDRTVVIECWGPDWEDHLPEGFTASDPSVRLEYGEGKERVQEREAP